MERTHVFIERELDRIHATLGDQRTNPDYAKLCAAQHALAWEMKPQSFKAPFI